MVERIGERIGSLSPGIAKEASVLKAADFTLYEPFMAFLLLEKFLIVPLRLEAAL
jgi:hypothetical protein